VSYIFKSPYSRYFAAGLFIFLAASFFTIGYHHPDEHFQVLEFANYKLGNSPVSDLPWEFNSRVRPTLQPFIAYLAIKCLTFVGIKNPFTYAFVLRALTGLFAWYIISKMSLLLLNHFTTETGKKSFIIMNFFLWYMPYISVRYSSESLSGLTFLCALYCILIFYRYSEEKKENFLLTANPSKNFEYLPAESKYNTGFLICSGIFLGFSIFFRFQISFAILGLGFWLVFVKKNQWKNLLIISSFAILSMAACIYLDYWFYGTFAFTPYNYYKFTVLSGRTQVGDPWWYYFALFILNAIPPISIFLLIFFVIGIYKYPKNIFAISFLFFLIIHMMFGNKEMRYMFPVSFSFIYLTALGMDYIYDRYKLSKVYSTIFTFMIILNFIILIPRSIAPASEKAPFYNFLNNYSIHKKTTVICLGKTLYEGAGIKINFYKSPNIDIVVLNKNMKINDYMNQHDLNEVLLFYDKAVFNDEHEGFETEKIYSIFPEWVLKYNINDWEKRTAIWSIYKITRQELKNKN